MSNTTKITVSGGFHNVSEITLKIRDEKMSAGQYKRLHNHLCGISGCICGGRGAEVSGMPKDAFWEMVVDAAADEYLSRRS